jgi:hypothetical protein
MSSTCELHTKGPEPANHVYEQGIFYRINTPTTADALAIINTFSLASIARRRRAVAETPPDSAAVVPERKTYGL